jgi:hypothetical protein
MMELNKAGFDFYSFALNVAPTYPAGNAQWVCDVKKSVIENQCALIRIFVFCLMAFL